MSRENFFIKATLKGDQVSASKGEKTTGPTKKIHINISHITSMVVSSDGGTTVLTSSGVVYECVQAPEYFILAGKGTGTIAEIGNG